MKGGSKSLQIQEFLLDLSKKYVSYGGIFHEKSTLEINVLRLLLDELAIF